MFLTAEEARNLTPRTDVENVLDQIEASIRRNSTQGQTGLEITALVPHWASWAAGRDVPHVQEVIDVLKEAGYKVSSAAGGYGSRGHLRISWAE